MSRHFGELYQLGYVVASVDSAVDDWIRSGVGPWEIIRSYPVDQWWYQGERAEIDVDIAIGWSGATQIELIEQTNNVSSMYLDYLATFPTGGLQHLGYRCADYDRAIEAGGAAGFTVLMNGLVGDTRFAYLKPPVGSQTPVVEISAGSAASMRRNEEKAGAARVWDGNNPILPIIEGR